MAERRLILIRHSLPLTEPGLPAARWRLSPEGLERARMLARKVDPGTATCVFTSPEPKAAETARVLASAWSVEVETIDGFREHERPDARMLRPEDFERRIGELFARPSEIVFGTESADAARQRFTDAVVRVIRRTVGDVVIVSHGTVIALFVADATGVEPFALWKRQEMPGAVILSVPDQ